MYVLAEKQKKKESKGVANRVILDKHEAKREYDFVEKQHKNAVEKKLNNEAKNRWKVGRTSQLNDKMNDRGTTVNRHAPIQLEKITYKGNGTFEDTNYKAVNDHAVVGAEMGGLRFTPHYQLDGDEVHLVQIVKEVRKDDKLYEEKGQKNIGYGDRVVKDGNYKGWAVDSDTKET